ncbi:nucleoside recognition protein [Desulfobulbus oligotrophicus]|uniref:Nucleoside recognition protein n=1 Tax=Desulfobulbus oligotrophicus TaxID=1909699 RepID=A0A7T5VEN7_9BACT|nr:nucleoside recognition protein [Desulfobulbus oligotrophicus]QQG66384.1 nucleoside recognition protein [Desulfobulbus oligotrophicus]
MYINVKNSLKSARTSALLILKFVVPLHILADILLYTGTLTPLAFLFTPVTKLLDLPGEAAMALISGVLLNIYAGIAFAAPLELTPYQWTVLAVFLGVCHSMIVESAIMAKLGISYGYSIILRGVGACVTVLPVLWMPTSFFKTGEQAQTITLPYHDSFQQMLVHSASSAFVLSCKIIVLISVIIVVMDAVKASSWVQQRLAKVNTSFSIIVGQLLGITYGAGILIRETTQGTLSRKDIFFISTFLMICHSLVEDVLLFVLFGANYWVIIGVRFTAALLISCTLLQVFRVVSIDRVVRS